MIGPMILGQIREIISPILRMHCIGQVNIGLQMAKIVQGFHT